MRAFQLQWGSKEFFMQIIGGVKKGQKIFSPKGDKTRPSSSKLREAFFNIVQNYIEGANFLDLFAGSGAMGLEALSRGASLAIFVDESGEAKRSILQNINKLGFNSCSLFLQGDVFKILEKFQKEGKSFDLIFADAPYIKGLKTGLKLLEIMDKSTLLKDKGMLFIENSEKTLEEQKIHSLKLISERRFGHSYLYQFQKN